MEELQQEPSLDLGESHDVDHGSVCSASFDKTPQDQDNGDKTKKYKYGIIYLSYIPDGLNVALVREIMSQWGEVGRVYLEPDEHNPTSKRKKYTEGWVEFKKKRIAKEVAKTLNGTVLQYGRKHSRVSGQTWSVKYLHRFKWVQLTDQLAHQKAVDEQKRRFEMSQAKKQSDFYQKMTERSRMMKKKRSHISIDSDKKGSALANLRTNQKKPITQGSELAVPVDADFLSSIFKKVT